MAIHPNERLQSPLEAVRRVEAEVKRRLAVERERADEAILEAERRARDLIAEAEAEGRREGEADRDRLLADAEREAAAVVERARAEAAALRQAGEAELEVAVARVIEIVVGGRA